MDYPTLDINIDRERAGQFGLTMADVARSVVPATSSSRFTQPNYWRDPNSGNAFQIQVELPQNRMQRAEEIGDIPVMQNGAGETRLERYFGNEDRHHAGFDGAQQRAARDQPDGQSARNHTGRSGASTESGRGQGRRSAARRSAWHIADKFQCWMRPSRDCGPGLLLAVLVIFLLLAANFQSLRLGARDRAHGPGDVVRRIDRLRLTSTTINLQSFMGAIMAIGIAVANSILLVTFAERFRREGKSIVEATCEGAGGRLRAILMTATAMTFGMLPMAMGTGEGGGQSAPLGRAVIGGLIVSTFATLTILPSIYAIFQAKASTSSASLNPDDITSKYYEPI